MKLYKFIQKIGDKAASKLFSTKDRPVSERTAKSWRLQERHPRQETALVILKKTKKHKYGPMTMDDIYKC